MNIVESQVNVAQKMISNQSAVTSQSANIGKEGISDNIRKQRNEANTYTLLLDADADARLSDSNVFILKSQESKTITVYASSENAGKQDMIAT